jgi:hypothetical protein
VKIVCILPVFKYITHLQCHLHPHLLARAAEANGMISGLVRMLDCSSLKVQVFNFSFGQDVALQFLEGASLRSFQFQVWSGCCIAVP